MPPPRPVLPDIPLEQLSQLLQSPAGRQELANAVLARTSSTPRAVVAQERSVHGWQGRTSFERQREEITAQIERDAELYMTEYDLSPGEDFADVPRPSRGREATRFRVDRGLPAREPFNRTVESGPQGGPMRAVGQVGRYQVMSDAPQRPQEVREKVASSPKPEAPIRRRNQWQHLLDED